MKRCLCTIFFATVIVRICAQDFTVPKNYTLESAKDFIALEQDIVEATDWLLNTPINKQPGKRKEVNSFLIRWLSGCPYITVELNLKILKFVHTSVNTTPDLLIIFMAGWTKYAIESKKYKDRVGGNVAGINAVVRLYTKNTQFLQKDKNIEKYGKLKDAGKLRKFIKKNMKTRKPEPKVEAEEI